MLEVGIDWSDGRCICFWAASINLLLHHKVQKFTSGTSSHGWCGKKGRKTVLVVCVYDYVLKSLITFQHYFILLRKLENLVIKHYYYCNCFTALGRDYVGESVPEETFAQVLRLEHSPK